MVFTFFTTFLKSGGINGYNPGLYPGLNPGLNSGLNPGLNPGLSPGLNSGLNSGLNPGLNSGLNPGLNSGLNHGLNSGLNHGLNSGLNQVRCITTCQLDGGCQVRIQNWQQVGTFGVSGSCFSSRFGGSCSGIPNPCFLGNHISQQCGTPCISGSRNIGQNYQGLPYY